MSSVIDRKTAVVEPTPTPRPIVLGKVAWGHIKEREKKNRRDWLLVGKALLEIRRIVFHELRLNEPKGGKYALRFSALCSEHGFGDIPNRVRADTLWLAENEREVLPIIGTTQSHPTAIRELYRAQVNATSDVSCATVDAATIALRAYDRTGAACNPATDVLSVEVEENGADRNQNGFAIAGREPRKERWLCDTRALLSDKYDELDKDSFLDLVMSLVKE